MKVSHIFLFPVLEITPMMIGTKAVSEIVAKQKQVRSKG